MFSWLLGVDDPGILLQARTTSVHALHECTPLVTGIREVMSMLASLLQCEYSQHHPDESPYNQVQSSSVFTESLALTLQCTITFSTHVGYLTLECNCTQEFLDSCTRAV